MSLVESSRAVLKGSPDRFFTAAEVAIEVTGRAPTSGESRRWENALLALVDHDQAVPLNHPTLPRGFRYFRRV